jgi:hypothetical protein
VLFVVQLELANYTIFKKGSDAFVLLNIMTIINFFIINKLQLIFKQNCEPLNFLPISKLMSTI